MKILIQLQGSKEWIGGIHYTNNIGRALKESGIKDIILHGDIDKDFEHIFKKNFSNILYTNSKDIPIKRFSKEWLITAILQNRFGIKIRSKKEKLEFDYNLFSLDPKILNHKKYNIMWIPDFQHKVYPIFFNKNEIERRDSENKLKIEVANKIIVSSENAKEDLLKFYNIHQDKISAIKFVPYIDKKFFDLDSNYVLSKYKIESPFVYMPNQFWIHKNHKIVVQAFTLLKENKIELVCSGFLTDYRNPNYFHEIEKLILDNKLQKKIKILGIVSDEDRFALFKLANLILNPSLFEGWSTSIEEAKAFKKTILASDIPVHREQLPNGNFFDKENQFDLAEKIKFLITQSSNYFSNSQLYDNNMNNIKNFGNDLLKTLKEI